MQSFLRATQTAQRAEQAANEWKNATTVSHLSGYAAAGYTNQENGTDSFDLANFNPIFHFQYGDRILWESELEVEVGEDGETDVGLEYSAIDIFINDYLVLVAGKFLSPLGNFRQNLHPAWINKLASAPPGFGHDGAAPIADVGIQLRGGFNIADQRKVTYAAYIANGPKLIGEDGEIHAVDTEGFASDEDDEKIAGGRVSLLPIPAIEFGLSGAFGDVAVVDDDGVAVVGDPSRAYQALGVDLTWLVGSFDVRGEYIQQDIDDETASVAPMGGKWETWYLQAARRFGRGKWEGVVRYTDFQSPHADESQEQWALGLNFILAPSAMIKLTYELNDGLAGEESDSNRWLVQVAYGY